MTRTSNSGVHWPLMKLEDVATIVMGQSPIGSSYNTDGNGEPLLNGPTEFGPVHPTAVQWTTAPTKFSRPGDILLCVRGATTGRRNIADQAYCIGRGLAAIRGNPQLMDTEFLSFALEIITYNLLKEASGSTFPNLPGDKLANVRIPLPPLAEQKRIVTILTKKLAAIAKARAAAQA